MREGEVKDIAHIFGVSSWVSGDVAHGDRESTRRRQGMMRSVGDTQKWRDLGNTQGREVPQDSSSLILPPLRDKSRCFCSCKRPGLRRYSRSACCLNK